MRTAHCMNCDTRFTTTEQGHDVFCKTKCAEEYYGLDERGVPLEDPFKSIKYLPDVRDVDLPF